jgi:hypothetical protein
VERQDYCARPRLKALGDLLAHTKLPNDETFTVSPRQRLRGVLLLQTGRRGFAERFGGELLPADRWRSGRPGRGKGRPAGRPAVAPNLTLHKILKVLCDDIEGAPMRGSRFQINSIISEPTRRQRASRSAGNVPTKVSLATGEERVGASTREHDAGRIAGARRQTPRDNARQDSQSR